MKTFKLTNSILSASLLVAVLLFVSCSGDTTGINHNNTGSSDINEFFSSIPDWEINEPESDPDIYNRTIEVLGPDTTKSDFDDGLNGKYECSIFDRHMVTTIRNFKSVGTNEGKIWPGAFIQGNSLNTGDIRLIQTNDKRADITLTTNLPLEEISKTITPSSVTAQQAIADFMIAAGDMPEGSKAGAGVMYFRVEEASTFNQSMRQMGFSAGFTEPQSQVGLDGSLAISNERSSHEHTVAAQFVQEKFKVRIADDLIATPADFFSDNFSTEDLEIMMKNGEIGSDNIPLYIEEVTYGRILLFSKTSHRAANANDVSAALEASMTDYVNAGGSMSDAQKELFEGSTSRIYSAGGSEGGANAAVANLDWSEFFVETSATEAVPISFVARTINGKKVVGLVTEENFEYRDNCSMIGFVEPPEPDIESYEITVEWRDTNNTGLCLGASSTGTCSPAAYVNVHKNWGFTRLTALNSFKREFIIYPGEDLQFTIRSTSTLKLPFGAYSSKTESRRYDVSSLNSGNTTLRHKMTNYAGSTELVYRITTKINYKD